MSYVNVDIVVPLCAPTRWQVADDIARQLAAYKFQHGPISAQELLGAAGRPEAWQVRVPFTAQSAAWGEYVLLRCGYARSGNYIEPRNAAWAAKYTQGAGPWQAQSCAAKAPDRPGAAEAVEGVPAAPPPPWSSKPRDWWHRRSPVVTKPAKRKRKRCGWCKGGGALSNVAVRTGACHRCGLLRALLTAHSPLRATHRATHRATRDER